MQLREARLCLDCEELHDGQQCPICASESFAFLTRWVPADERRHRKRVRQPPDPTQAAGKNQKWLTGSVAGLALFAVSRWLMRPTEESDDQRAK